MIATSIQGKSRELGWIWSTPFYPGVHTAQGLVLSRIYVDRTVNNVHEAPESKTADLRPNFESESGFWQCRSAGPLQMMSSILLVGVKKIMK